MQLAVAVALALASAVCYAVSAVLQHREASRSTARGLHLLAGLVRRHRRWAALAVSVVGAMLHVAALGAGPLVLVQPLGVSTLVFALLIGAQTGVTPVTRRSALGAGCVVVGLPLVLSVVPRHPHPAGALLAYRWAAAALLVIVVSAVACGRLSTSRAQLAAACYAVGAATCFGLTSGTVGRCGSGTPHRLPSSSG